MKSWVVKPFALLIISLCVFNPLLGKLKVTVVNNMGFSVHFVKAVDFDPLYNLERGFTVELKPGTTEIFAEWAPIGVKVALMGSQEPLMQKLFDESGKEVHYAYMPQIRWTGDLAGEIVLSNDGLIIPKEVDTLKSAKRAPKSR